MQVMTKTQASLCWNCPADTRRPLVYLSVCGLLSPWLRDDTPSGYQEVTATLIRPLFFSE